MYGWLNEQVTSSTASMLSLERTAGSTVEAIGEWRDRRRKTEDCSGGSVTALRAEALASVAQQGKEKWVSANQLFSTSGGEQW